MESATNSSLMRKNNEKIILAMINKEPVSRADIAKRTGLTKAAVTIIVDDLKRRDIVTEKNGKSDTVGRNPVMLYLNKGAFYIAGINITRRDITFGITDLGGNITAQKNIEICPPEKAFTEIIKGFEEQIARMGMDISKIYKMSVVAPGPVDLLNGVILNPPNFNEWHGVPIVKELESRTGLKVILENVSSAIAIAEKYFGAAKNTADFLALQVDEGIGSGIVIGDSLFKGPCEIGHTSIKYDGKKCECGNRGCLEKYASIPAILAGTDYKTWREVIENDDECLIEKEAQYLSTAIISANNIFKLDKIVICGDLAYKPEKITEFVLKRLKKHIFFKNKFDICAGKVDSKLKFAAALAINDFFV